MIIWRGMGLAIPAIFAICYFCIKYLLGEDLQTSFLHHGVALLTTALFIIFTMWKRNRDLRKLFESGNAERIEKYRKIIEANPAMDIDNSELFFIAFKTWPYILGVGGLILCIVHFLNG